MRRFFYECSDHADTSDNHYPKLSTFSMGSTLELTDSIAHHWCRVLRATTGDTGILFDGFGGEYQVQLKDIQKKRATVDLLAYSSDDKNAPVISKIALVMSRGDRMDYAIQKATELGVTAIQLLSSHHGEVTLKSSQIDKKLTHWQQIAIAACEQCGLNRVPLILAPLSINEWLESTNGKDDSFKVSSIMTAVSHDAYYQALHKEANLRLQLSVPAAGHPLMPAELATVLAQRQPYIELLIGPEGGLSQDEYQQARIAGFLPWQIGNRVLRTETAPVVALSTLHALSNIALP